MASITISRGTPFSAASWVMAVTNSLFMLAFPPLSACELAIRPGPTTKEVGATQFQVRRVRQRLRPVVPKVSISQSAADFARLRAAFQMQLRIRRVPNPRQEASAERSRGDV